jgi:hypothetical protein
MFFYHIRIHISSENHAALPHTQPHLHLLRILFIDRLDSIKRHLDTGWSQRITMDPALGPFLWLGSFEFAQC